MNTTTENAMQGTVTTADWRRAGFNDGRDGNSKMPPRGCAVSRGEYTIGYREGRAERIAFYAAP